MKDTENKIPEEVIEPISIYDRIAAIMAKLGNVKASKNNRQGKPYRNKEDYYRALQPLLAQYGVVMSKEVLSFEEAPPIEIKGGAWWKVTLMLRVSFGSTGGVVSTDVLVSKFDNWDSGFLGAMSIGIARAYEDVFCVPMSDPVDYSEEIPEEVKAPVISKELREQIAKTPTKKGLNIIYNDYPQLQALPEFKRLLKVRESILDLAIKDQKTIKKASELPAQNPG